MTNKPEPPRETLDYFCAECGKASPHNIHDEANLDGHPFVSRRPAPTPETRRSKCMSCEIWKCESPGCKCKCHEVGTPEPPPKGQMEYDKWSDKAFVNRYEKSLAGTPETPSGPEPFDTWGKMKDTFTGETPSALSAEQFRFSGKWRGSKRTNPTEYWYEFAEAYAATLREEIEDLRGIVRDERALRKGQLEEVEGKLATAQQTIEDLQDCASLEGNAKATERALDAEKKLATAEREAQSWKVACHDALRRSPDYKRAEAAERERDHWISQCKIASGCVDEQRAELARVKEALQEIAELAYVRSDDPYDEHQRIADAALRPGDDKLNSKEKA